MFLYAISVLFSTTVLALPNGRTEVTYPSLETLRSGMKIMTVRAFGKDVELKLKPAGDVIADDFTIMDGDGKIQISNVENLKRKLFRNEEKDAALYINEEGPLEIKGMLTSKLRIEPYESQDMVKDGIKAHRITETLVERKGFHDAVFTSNLKSFSDYDARNFNEDQCVEIEYLFVTGSTVTKRFGSFEEIQSYVASMFVKVQNMMDTLNLNIKVRLIGVKTFTDENEPSFVQESLIPGKDIFNVNHILENFSNYYCQHQQDELAKRADIIMFGSRRALGEPKSDGNTFDGILGVAHLGGACDPCKKYGVIVDSDDFFDTDDTVTHESAHVIGSPHDGEGAKYSLPGSPAAEKCPGSNGFIMGDDFGKNQRKFSTCSRENIKYFLNKTVAHCIITDCKKEHFKMILDY